MALPGLYDQPPVYGFTASTMPGLPSTLDQINPNYYYQIEEFIKRNGGRLASITGVELYDTVRIDPGTLIVKDFLFFQAALNQQQGLFISGTQYTKQEIDVHPWIVGGGQLAKGYEALIWAIGVQFHIVMSADSTLQTTGNFINLTLDPGTLSGQVNTNLVRMSNLMRAFQEGTYFQLYVNQTGFEDGPGWRFPCGLYGMNGVQSISTTTTATTTTLTNGDGYINNGTSFAYQMPIMRHIPELTRFGVRMKLQNPFVIDAGITVRVVVTLGGIGLTPVTG